jgi:hypothetical protein
MSLVTILIVIILLIIVFGALPTWPYTRSYGWGYYPSGIVFVLLLIFIVLLLTGRLGTL